ncbi:MAG: nitroreductase/quinone reductase family protein, partial [Actinomycetota bacterium]
MAAVRRNKLTETMWAMHRALYRISGGRMGGKIGGHRVLQLTTIGRRSGEPRTVLLTCVEHDDGWVVVASHAGEQNHPPWWLNLAARPEATVRYKRKESSVHARELDGEERERLYARFEDIDKAYA